MHIKLRIIVAGIVLPLDTTTKFGEIDHLTSDLDQLSILKRYHGKDQVQVANGIGLHISHIGYSKI